MTRAQLASGRQQLPFSSGNVAVTSGGSNSVSRTYYLALLGENPAGMNLLSTIVGPVTIASGQQLAITVPNTSRLSGEGWTNYVIGVSTSNTPSTFTQLAKVDAYSGSSPISLPATLTLDTNEKLDASPNAVGTSASLPASPIHGMIRVVNGLGSYYEFVAGSTESPTPDGAAVKLILNATGGRWFRVPSRSVYVAATTDPGGCDRSIQDIDPDGIVPSRYASDGAQGKLLTYWLLNNDGSAITAGKRIGATVYQNGAVKSALFAGKLKLIFRGYTDSATGLLRTTDNDDGSTLEGIGIEQTYSDNKSGLFLPDDLDDGEAYVFDAYPQFSASQFNEPLVDGTIITIIPFFYDQAGAYNPAGEVVGNIIYAKFDRRRVLPTSGLFLNAAKGSGTVYYKDFIGVGPTTVSGIQANTASQKIAINGNGTVYWKGSAAIESTEALRAIVSTVSGVSVAGAATAVTVSGSQGVSLTVAFPTTIRGDYPDLIAGVTATPNAPSITVYARHVGSGVIRKFTGIAIVPTGPQTIELSDWTGATTIGSIPAAPTADFSCFAPAGVTPVVSAFSGTFPAGSMEFSYAFEYTGNTVTKITHTDLACIHEQQLSYAEIEENNLYWAAPVADIAALRAVPFDKIVGEQTRRVVATSLPYTFRATLLGADNGTTVIKPNDRTVDQPGRWTPSQSASTDSIPILPVLTAAAMRAITNYKSPLTDGVVDFRFFFPNGSLYWFDPNSLETDDGVIYFRPTAIASDAPGRYKMYLPPSYHNIVVSGGEIVTSGEEIVTGTY
jgi:hypothetical protein